MTLFSTLILMCETPPPTLANMYWTCMRGCWCSKFVASGSSGSSG